MPSGERWGFVSVSACPRPQGAGHFDAEGGDWNHHKGSFQQGHRQDEHQPGKRRDAVCEGQQGGEGIGPHERVSVGA